MRQGGENMLVFLSSFIYNILLLFRTAHMTLLDRIMTTGLNHKSESIFLSLVLLKSQVRP